MSFVEIARALGYRDPVRGAKSVEMLYRSAIRKLRARPVTMARLRELAEARERVREEQERGD